MISFVMIFLNIGQLDNQIVIKKIDGLINMDILNFLLIHILESDPSSDNMKLVSEMLRHSDIITTEIYARIAMDNVKKNS
jgi:hypothetical protein